MNDHELIKAVKKGDEKAFHELVENYQQMIIGTALGFVGNLDDAHDITQEVFIEIYRSINSFRADSSLSTWIYRITITRSLNHIRREKRHKEQIIADIDIREETSDPLEDADRKKILHLAISSLPKNQQIAFTLHNYEDLSYKQIAQIMQRSISSVESLIFRARKNLQKKLWEWYKNSRV
jgi:RNA polymerase sigma-70 factor, ECF subfamily